MNFRKDFERILREALEEHLAARAFAKDRLGFHRKQRWYIEHYSFQSSQGNVNHIKCRYYLNVGLEFPVLSRAAVWAFRRESGLVSWLGDEHVSLVHIRDEIVWATRADNLVRGLPPHWEIQPGSDLDATKRDILAAIDACAGRMAPWAKGLRGRVLAAWVLGWLAWPFIRHRLTGPSKRLQATRSKPRAPRA